MPSPLEKARAAARAVDAHVLTLGFWCEGVGVAPHEAFDLRASWDRETGTHQVLCLGCSAASGRYYEGRY